MSDVLASPDLNWLIHTELVFLVYVANAIYPVLLQEIRGHVAALAPG
jgi:hypothetical protein